ncbi:MAG: hypothetical protein ACR2OG_13315 [Gemmatimonadaceae bacterium]
MGPRGWAIECRITSEDPANDFLPSTGRVSHLSVPGGPGVRWDGGIAVGSDVGLFYDALLAKLIVWAPTRDAAIRRMRRALLELTVEGVETSRDFHLRVMEDEEFGRGEIEIQWLERRLSSLIHRPAPEEGIRVAAIAAALLAHEDRAGRLAGGGGGPAPGPAREPDSEGWRRVARRDGMREG